MKLQHHAEWISRQSLKGKKYIEGKDYERLETFEEKIRSDRKRDTKKRDVIKNHSDIDQEKFIHEKSNTVIINDS